jgi:hypothetical protein
MRTTTKVSTFLTWHIYQIVVDCFSLVVTTCVLNQSRGHWLLSDAFHFVISMSLKLKEEPKNAPSFQTLMEEDFGVALELTCLASNIRKDVCGILDIFLSFLKKFDERKTCNMLTLILLDPRFKSFHLVSFFIGCDQGVAIIEEYDTMSLYPMLMKCYYYLHPSIEFDNDFANQKVYDDSSLDIFQMIARSTNPTKKLVKRELLVS